VKVQISNFSTHQTAKVFAFMMAATSLLFFLPFGMLSLIGSGPVAEDGTEVSMMPFTIMFLIFPLIQGLFGYVFVRIGMWAYNKLSPRVGGFEFEVIEIKPKEG
jgi:TRAP-type C4-dicarboxylate transport system permease small subunit